MRVYGARGGSPLAAQARGGAQVVAWRRRRPLVRARRPRIGVVPIELQRDAAVRFAMVLVFLDGLLGLLARHDLVLQQGVPPDGAGAGDERRVGGGVEAGRRRQDSMVEHGEKQLFYEVGMKRQEAFSLNGIGLQNARRPLLTRWNAKQHGLLCTLGGLGLVCSTRLTTESFVAEGSD